MASYTVTPGQIGQHEKTLTAGQVDTVTFTTGSRGLPGWANLPKAVEILSDGVADIYVTVDGSTPTVAGGNCFRLPALGGSLTVSTQDSDPTDDVVVKLISSGTPKYSVSRAG